MLPEQNLDSSSNYVSSALILGHNANSFWRNAADDGKSWIQATLLAFRHVYRFLIQRFDTSTSAASHAKNVMIQTELHVSTLTYIRNSCDQPPLTFTANDKAHALIYLSLLTFLVLLSPVQFVWNRGTTINTNTQISSVP